MIIYRNNLKRFLSLKFIIIYFLILIPFFIGFTALFNAQGWDISNTFDIVRDEYLASYFVGTFMCTLGLPYLITIASRSVNLFQQEIDDNTLVLIVSKPITRKKIFFEKIFALFSAMILIGIISIFVSLSIYILVYNLDSMILAMLISLVPSLIIYLLVINFIYCALSILIVSLFKQRIKAIITLIVFIMAFQLILPFLKPLMFPTIYEKYYIYYFDVNYHFGLIYHNIIALLSNIEFSPLAQIRISDFISIFQTALADNYDNDLGFTPSAYLPLNYLNSVVVTVIWLLLASIFIFLSYVILKNKDID